MTMTTGFCLLSKYQHFPEIPKCAPVVGIGNSYSKVFATELVWEESAELEIKRVST